MEQEVPEQPDPENAVIEMLRRQAEEGGEGAPDNEMLARAFPELKMPCRVLGTGTSHRRNGATYVVNFEVPVTLASAVLMMPDGLKVTFMDVNAEIIEVGDGAYIASSASSRDPDGGRHYKIKVQFPASAMESTGPLNLAIKEDRNEGTLKLEAQQGTFGLKP
jgi:hypothetical protein